MTVRCKACPAIFDSEKKMRKHRKAVHGKCPVCGKVCQYENGLAAHTQAMHGLGGPPLPKCSQICELCPGSIFESRKALKRHMKSVHAVGGQCNTCGKVFKDHSALASHIKAKKHGYVAIPCEARRSGDVPDTVPTLLRESDQDGIHAISDLPHEHGPPSAIEVRNEESSHNGHPSPLDQCYSNRQHACQFTPEHAVSETDLGNECSDEGRQMHVEAHLTPRVLVEGRDVAPSVYAGASPNNIDVESEMATPRLSCASASSYSDLAPSPSITSASSEMTPEGMFLPGARIGAHCRICQKDPSDELTATMCGHLFCKSCITEEIIARSACPVCKNAVLLYCLFRIDLSA